MCCSYYYRFIGEAYLELRDIDTSLRNVRSYLKLVQETSDLEKQRAYTTLGRVYAAKYDIEGTPGTPNLIKNGFTV